MAKGMNWLNRFLPVLIEVEVGVGDDYASVIVEVVLLSTNQIGE